MKLRNGMIVNVKSFRDDKIKENKWGIVLNNYIYDLEGYELYSIDYFNEKLEHKRNNYYTYDYYTYIDEIKYHIGLYSWNAIDESIKQSLNFIKKYYPICSLDNWGTTVYKRGIDKEIADTFIINNGEEDIYFYVDKEYKCIKDFKENGYSFKKDKWYYIKQKEKSSGVNIVINNQKIKLSDKSVKDNFEIVKINLK